MFRFNVYVLITDFYPIAIITIAAPTGHSMKSSVVSEPSDPLDESQIGNPSNAVLQAMIIFIYQ